MIRFPSLIALLCIGAPALAVGLGPLTKSGVTDGEAKAFYLTLINPYPHVETFHSVAIGADDEVRAERVALFPADVAIGGGRSRKLLVIVRPLKPGETYAFRVCAAKTPAPQETIHARVCSKLAARRLGPRS